MASKHRPRKQLPQWRPLFRRASPYLIPFALLAYLGGLLIRDTHLLVQLGFEIRHMPQKIESGKSHGHTLALRAEDLQSLSTVELIARERLHLVKPGEELYRIIPEGR